jgi:hypothetical protein
MAHGSHWQAIVESTDQVTEYLPDFIRHALPVDGQKPDPSAEYFYCRSSQEPLGTLAVIRDTGGESHHFVAAYPVCWEGARNELEVHSIEPLEEEDGESFEAIVKTILSDATEVSFFSPLFQNEKQTLSENHRFIFGLSAIAYTFRKADSEITIDGGPMLDLERDRRKDEPGFDPASVTSVTLNTSQMRYFMDRKEGDFEFQAPVEEVTSFTSHFSNGKILLINLRPEDEVPLHVKLYVSEKELKGYDPHVGDPVMGVAWLQGRILEVVETSDRWMDSGEVAQNDSSNDPIWRGVSFLFAHPELPLGMAVLGAAFVSADWKIIDSESRLFCKWYVPLIVQKGAVKYWVLYKTTIEGFCETNLLSEEQIKIFATVAEKEGAKVLDLTVNLKPMNTTFRVSLEGLGELAEEIRPILEVKKPEDFRVVKLDSNEKEPDPVLDEAVAAMTMAKCISDADLREISKMLVEDLEYTADTIGKRVLGRQAYLSHVGCFLDERKNEGVNIYAKTGVGILNGVKRACAFTFKGNHKKPFTCTFFTGRQGHIGSILNIPPEKLDYYEVMEPPSE